MRSHRAVPLSSYPLKPRPAQAFTDSPDHAKIPFHNEHTKKQQTSIKTMQHQ